MSPDGKNKKQKEKGKNMSEQKRAVEIRPVKNGWIVDDRGLGTVRDAFGKMTYDGVALSVAQWVFGSVADLVTGLPEILEPEKFAKQPGPGEPESVEKVEGGFPEKGWKGYGKKTEAPE